jgi:hypothetical protein
MRGRGPVEGWSQIGENKLPKAFSRYLYLRGLFCEIGLVERSEIGFTMRVDILQHGLAGSLEIARLLLAPEGFEEDGQMYFQRPVE